MSVKSMSQRRWGDKTATQKLWNLGSESSKCCSLRLSQLTELFSLPPPSPFSFSANVVSASDRLVPGLTSSCQDLPQTSPTFTISKRHTIRCTVTCLGKTKNCIPAEGLFKIPLSALFRGVFVLLCIRNNWLLDSGPVWCFQVSAAGASHCRKGS